MVFSFHVLYFFTITAMRCPCSIAKAKLVYNSNFTFGLMVDIPSGNLT